MNISWAFVLTKYHWLSPLVHYQLSQALSIASYIRTKIAYELPRKRTLFFAFVLCPMIPLRKRSFDNLQDSFWFERRAFLLIWEDYCSLCFFFVWKSMEEKARASKVDRLIGYKPLQYPPLDISLSIHFLPKNKIINRSSGKHSNLTVKYHPRNKSIRGTF